jgi:hypothetical protein
MPIGVDKNMERVIDGKLYDTNEARQVAEWRNMADTGDFGFCREVLYVTENGRYFIFGEGGPKTSYSQRTGDGWAGGKEIKPITSEAALQWCEDKSIKGEIVAEEFDDEIEPA